MPKPTTVYGIVSFGGHLVRGMVRVVLTTEEPLTVLESDKLYYGENVKARVTKTKVLTMSELTEKLEKEFETHKTDVPHMYKLNSSESVKILKTVFDVKTCKKLSFSKDSDDDSDDNESTISAKDEEQTTKSTKSTKSVEPAPSKSTKGTTGTKSVEPAPSKSTKGTKSVEESASSKSTKGTKDTKSVEESAPSKSTKGTKETKSKGTEDTIAKKPDLTDSKKTTTSKVKESKVRIPLSDSEDDEHALDS
jgi:hypothetical protein